MAAAYVAAMLAYVYAYANTSLLSDSDAAAAAILAVLVGLHIATGWASGRWWSIFLPLTAVVLAIPAGNPMDGYEPFPIWFGLAVTALSAAAIGAGIGIRRLASARP